MQAGGWTAPAFVLIWSSGYLVGAIATSVIAPLAVTLWRFVLAAGVLAAIAWRRGERWPHGARALGLVVSTGVLLFAVQFGGIYIGLADGMPAATTALIACSAPLLVAVAGVALGWDRLGRRQLARYRSRPGRRGHHTGRPGRPPAQSRGAAVGAARPGRPGRRVAAARSDRPARRPGGAAAT